MTTFYFCLNFSLISMHYYVLQNYAFPITLRYKTSQKFLFTRPFNGYTTLSSSGCPLTKLTLHSRAVTSSFSTSIILLTHIFLSSITYVLATSHSHSIQKSGSALMVKCPRARGSSDGWHITSPKTLQVNPCVQAVLLTSPLIASLLI